MNNKKRSFFERLTGSVHLEEEPEEKADRNIIKLEKKNSSSWMEGESEEAELTVDVYQTGPDIMVQTMVAGVKPEDLDITIARDMVTIRGTRGENRNVDEGNYFTKELYWGKFSRSILLPQEIEPEEAEALEKHGLLTIKLKKVDKEKRTTIRVKSI